MNYAISSELVVYRILTSSCRELPCMLSVALDLKNVVQIKFTSVKRKYIDVFYFYFGDAYIITNF